jgi:tRNA dimethylallyltransferase
MNAARRAEEDSPEDHVAAEGRRRLPLAAIVGPTASGKTALSIRVAQRLQAEIISMDSRQVYRGMDIGTAKATPEQRTAVPHHGLDVVDPDERFGAGRFARAAAGWIDGIRNRNHLPLLVGGTGFFLRALINPIFREPDLDAGRRARLQRLLDTWETPELHRWLEAMDPPIAETLKGWGGRQRLVRSLELPLLTGRPLSWWHENAPPDTEPLRPAVFVLEMSRERLYAAINRRVGEMEQAGLVEEVRSLLAAGFHETDPGMNATGYVELFPFLRGEISLENALEEVRRHTRAYARRQLTWFRHQLPDDAVWLDATRDLDALADEVVERLREAA